MIILFLSFGLVMAFIQLRVSDSDFIRIYNYSIPRQMEENQWNQVIFPF